MENCEQIIANAGILPVINIPAVELAKPLALSILNGGISAMEVTLRSECSLDAIQAIKKDVSGMVVGAGTVFSINSVEKAIEAGADYIVTPGYDDEIVDYCIEKGIAVFPGCSTPTEIQHAAKKGLKVLKFFPSELSGGNAAIKLLSGPFQDIKFLPTGGITFSNLADYMSNKSVIACGGSFMATSDQVKNQKFDEITVACKKAIQISLGFDLSNVYFNGKSGDEANNLKNIAGLLDDSIKNIFDLSVDGKINPDCCDEKGCIEFYTNSISRAIAWFERNNVEFRYESSKTYGVGIPISIYLKEKIKGFTLRVVEI